MKRITLKGNALIAVIISVAVTLVGIANLIICYIYDIQKEMALIILICLLAVLLLNIGIYIMQKKKKKQIIKDKNMDIEKE